MHISKVLTIIIIHCVRVGLLSKNFATLASHVSYIT